jgi:hypothetical protein
VNLFGRRRYQARQQARSEALGDAYRRGIEHGRMIERSAQREANPVGRMLERLENAQCVLECGEPIAEVRRWGAEVVAGCEALLSGGLPPGWDDQAQDVHGGSDG